MAYAQGTTLWEPQDVPDAMRTLTDYLFSKMNVQLCWVETVIKNERALRAHEKTGFKITRKFVEDGVECAHLELAKND
ncbi:MAG: hypothetical protein Q8M92_08260 [Candidatus Subteraquimicrobiales bacterium]|nr:hypothetical protein [Candidatus Subteraquimicrobiales bacterium]